MKKKILCFMTLIAVVFSLHASNIEDLISKAKSNSSVYQNYEISHSNSLLAQQQKDLSSGVIVKVDGGYKMGNGTTSVGSSDNYPTLNSALLNDSDSKGKTTFGNYPTLNSALLNDSDSKGKTTHVITPSSVTVSIPDLIDDLNLSVSASLSQINLVDKKPFSLSPSLSVSKDFNIRNFKDTRSDIEDLKTDLQIEIGYKTNVYNFENTFINAIINIMQTEDKLNDSKTSYARMLNNYENGVRLGSIIEGSLTDMEQTMRLNSTKVSLDAMENNLSRAKKDFAQQYGIEYEEVTYVRDADLAFNPSEGGNNTVYIAYLNLQSAQQTLDAQKGFEDKLSLGASASTSIPFNTDKKNIAVSVGASVKYKTDTWEVSTTVSDTFSKEKTKIPTVTVAGSWSNTTTKSKSEKLTLQMAENSVLEKETAFSNALYNYETSVQSLETEIENYNLDGAQLKIQKDYHKSVYDYEAKLFDLGLTTQQNLDDARTNYEKDLRQEIIWKLQGLVLENKIKTIGL